MSMQFEDVSVIDLVNTTEFLHHINPSLKDMFVFGIEKAKPGDQNVVFHLVERIANDKSLREKRTFILSAQYILEHDYWKKER